MTNQEQDPSRESLRDRMRRLLGSGSDDGMPGMFVLTPDGGRHVRQTELAPGGFEFCPDVSPGRWVQERLSGFARLHALLPPRFQPMPGCSIRPIWAVGRTSQSGGPRWLPGWAAPSIP